LFLEGVGAAFFTPPNGAWSARRAELILSLSTGARPGRVLQIVLPDKAEALLKFRPSVELQDRIEVLAGKSTEGTLTEAERAEYEGYVRANKFVALLQRLARQMAGAS
jgi:hypothetical protein